MSDKETDLFSAKKMIADLYMFEVQQMVFQAEHNDWQTVHSVRVAWNVFSNYIESVWGGSPVMSLILLM